MKTLTVYVEGSFIKFPNLFEDYTMSTEEGGILVIRERDRITGEEKKSVAFKEWIYYTIEEDNGN